MSAHFEYLLRLGDGALILGQRLSEWCGHGPELEEDVALTNIALDLIGTAQMLLDHAGDVEGKGRDADALAYLRDGTEFRNPLMMEQPNGNFADTIMRQFLVESWAVPLWQGLENSTDKKLAQIAAKASKEAKYHLQHCRQWVLRLGDGTKTSHDKAQAALDRLWTYTGEWFVNDAVEQEMLDEQIAVPVSRDQWLTQIRQHVAQATLSLPDTDAWMASGGKQGRHSEYLGYILAEMQSLHRAHPGVSW